MPRKSLILILAALCLAGCSTTRQERSKIAAASMRDVNQMLAKGAEQTVAVQAAAKTLAQVQAGDIRGAYERYSKEARKLRALAADARDQGQAMRKRSKSYFARWEKELAQISNRDLKQMSQERQALLQSEYGEISAAMNALSQAYVTFEATLDDVEKFLGNDLTPTGLRLAKPHLQRLDKEADAVLAGTRKAQAAISHLADVLKPR